MKGESSQCAGAASGGAGFDTLTLASEVKPDKSRGCRWLCEAGSIPAKDGRVGFNSLVRGSIPVTTGREITKKTTDTSARCQVEGERWR